MHTGRQKGRQRARAQVVYVCCSARRFRLNAAARVDSVDMYVPSVGSLTPKRNSVPHQPKPRELQGVSRSSPWPLNLGVWEASRHGVGLFAPQYCLLTESRLRKTSSASFCVSCPLDKSLEMAACARPSAPCKSPHIDRNPYQQPAVHRREHVGAAHRGHGLRSWNVADGKCPARGVVAHSRTARAHNMIYNDAPKSSAVP